MDTKALNMRWGGWRLDKEAVALVYEEMDYDVRLSECNSSAQILDWIIQIAEKTWATNDVIGELVRALNDILGIQGNFCSQGQSLNADGKALAELYIRRAERIPKPN